MAEKVLDTFDALDESGKRYTLEEYIIITPSDEIKSDRMASDPVTTDPLYRVKKGRDVAKVDEVTFFIMGTNVKLKRI
jgi:hypothetical protein